MSVKVEITDLAYGGKGVGRIDGKVIFVPYTAPGDVALVDVIVDKKGFSEGVVTELIEGSPDRVEPPCPYFGVCGGCSLQHIGYERQVELKGRIFDETMRRMGKVDFEVHDAPTPSPDSYGYRARARFHVAPGKGDNGGRLAVGFFREGSNTVVEIDACPVLTPALNHAYGLLVAALGSATGADQKRLASLYAMEVTASPTGGRFAAVFHTSDSARIDWEGILSGVAGLAGFEVIVDQRRNFQGARLMRSGDLEVRYSVAGLDMRASASVFMQANAGANGELVERALEYAGAQGEAGLEPGSRRAVDLYSGVGNITVPLAVAGFDVTGVESVHEAVAIARRNIPRDPAGRVVFKSARVLDWLKHNFNTLESAPPDVIVLDPPRASEKGVAALVAGLRPPAIVYVSCSPPVLARDLTAFTAHGYRPLRCGVIDMFPQTYHIEAVVRLAL